MAAFGTSPPKIPVAGTSVRKGRRSNTFAEERVVRLTLDDSRLHARYAAALRREVEHYLGECNPPAIQTLYFGGGTPSATVDLVSQCIDLVRPWLQADAEISIEIHPADASRTLFDQLRATGVNRVSLGVETFPPFLQTIC